MLKKTCNRLICLFTIIIHAHKTKITALTPGEHLSPGQRRKHKAGMERATRPTGKGLTLSFIRLLTTTTTTPEKEQRSTL